MPDRERVKAARRWVVKLGSALLTGDGQGLDRASIQGWVDQMATLKSRGVELVLVSSGSIAEGMSRLGWRKRPAALYELQAAAAVGQMGIAQVYQGAFQRHGLHTAQILLTHDDVSDRARYLNARSTLRKLLDLDVVPVVNENDTVSTEAIKLGDNDTLAGLVCNLVQAELFVILTDQQGLYSADPRLDAEATLIGDGLVGDEGLRRMAGDSGRYGRGGMRTKLRAAALAARSGALTVIGSGRERDVLLRLAVGESLGTLLSPTQGAIAARKQWLAGQLNVRGHLSLDAGAAEVLKRSGKSLLAVGVKAVSGNFGRGELVACLDPEDREIARGLVNYDALETRKIKGMPSGRIFELLGYVDEPELIHRDNLVLTGD